MFDVILAHEKDLGCNSCNCAYQKTYIFKRYLDLSFIPGSFYASRVEEIFDPYNLSVNVNVNIDWIPFCRNCFFRDMKNLYDKYLEVIYNERNWSIR